MTRRYLLIGALFGAGGVALHAAAAHLDNASALASAAQLLMIHGVLLVSLALHANLGIILRLGSAAIAFGTTLFSASIMLKYFKGHHLFTDAAPIGGSIMIIGWCVLAIAALLRKH